MFTQIEDGSQLVLHKIKTNNIFNLQNEFSFFTPFRYPVDLVVQISQNSRFSINPAISVSGIEVSQMNFIGIIPDYNK